MGGGRPGWTGGRKCHLGDIVGRSHRLVVVLRQWPRRERQRISYVQPSPPLARDLSQWSAPPANANGEPL